MSFFYSFFGTCCGTEIFCRLQRVSFFKALLHLFILIFLCAFFVGSGEYFLNRKTWKRCENLFCEQFGVQIHNVAGIWKPSIASKISRSLQLPFQTLVLYVSADDPENYPDDLFAGQRNVFLWAPGCFASATKIANEQWLFMHYLPGGQLNAVPAQLDFRGMRKQLDSAILLPAGKWSSQEQSFDCHAIFDMLRFCYAAVLGLGYAFNSLVMILLDTLCFALIFRIFNNRQRDFLSFAELWKIGIYAAFPVFAVVTAVAALQLPLAAYGQTVFMIGWMIYLLVILYSLRKQPESTSENGENNGKQQ